jgi:4-aminobutyrate aminotransferase-like enzyme
VNRIKELGVLMSNDGLDKNVIKIKPPLIFSIEDSKKLLLLFEKVLKENFMRSI